MGSSFVGQTFAVGRSVSGMPRMPKSAARRQEARTNSLHFLCMHAALGGGNRRSRAFVTPISILLRREDKEFCPGPGRAGYRVSGSGLAWEAVSIELVLSWSNFINIHQNKAESHKQPPGSQHSRGASECFCSHEPSKETSYHQLTQESGLLLLSSVVTTVPTPTTKKR